MERERFAPLAARLVPRISRRHALGVLTALGTARTLTANIDAHKRKHKHRHRPHCPAACPICQSCTDGRTCSPQPDDTSCQGTGRCGSGVCHAAPVCVSVNQSGCSDVRPCCNGMCIVIQPFGAVCAGQGGHGATCNGDGDCTSGSCVAFRCA